MLDKFYGAAMGISGAKAAIAAVPSSGYTFKHFLFKQATTGAGNIYLFPFSVYENGAARFTQSFSSWVNATTYWENQAVPAESFLIGNIIMDLSTFNLLCPPGVTFPQVADITISVAGILVEPTLESYHLYYQGSTILPGNNKRNVQNLNPSPPHVA